MRPMLAAKVAFDQVRYPTLASPKLDGIRCVIWQGKALTRNLKPVPNRHVREWLEANCPDGWDGELMLPDPATFQDISSCFMSQDTEPPSGWFYAVFDWQPGEVPDTSTKRGRCAIAASTYTAEGRIAKLKSRATEFYVADLFHVRVVPYTPIYSSDDLQMYEAKCLELGYEGVMCRDPLGPYKYGRSTVNEGWLLKLKRFEDSDAVVVGYAELARNENVATVSELGLTKRSHAKAGKRAAELLGALVVTDLYSGVEFEIGTGFTEAQRRNLWIERDFLVGRTLKYKHFAASGVKDKPRFPVFLGWRDRGDMDVQEDNENGQ